MWVRLGSTDRMAGKVMFLRSNQGGRLDGNESVADSFRSDLVGFKSWFARILGAFLLLLRLPEKPSTAPGSAPATRGNRDCTGMWVRLGSTDRMAGKVMFLRSNQGGRLDGNESVADSFRSDLVGFKSWSARILGAFLLLLRLPEKPSTAPGSAPATRGNGSQITTSSRIGVHETFRSAPSTQDWLEESTRMPEIFMYCHSQFRTLVVVQPVMYLPLEVHPSKYQCELEV
ncbi:hypothetical protein TNCV_1416201 [Trichonephila clavipes]|nr:hypothetical protein TNCV_1416201 [Trichonephila clavipes]